MSCKLSFFNENKKEYVVLGVAASFCVLLLYLFYNINNFRNNLKKISLSSKKVAICELHRRYGSDQCREVNIADIIKGVSRGNSTLPPSKVKVKAEYLLVFYDHVERKNCYLLIDYESDDLNLIINDIVPNDNCTGVKKYLASYYEIDRESIKLTNLN